MHNFSKKKKGLFISSETKQLLICLTTSSPYNGWLWGNVAGALSWWMCCTADFFTYFHKMIGTSEYTCMCLCVCQYVCNTIHARSATKIAYVPPLFWCWTAQVFRQRPLGIFTHTWLTVFSLCFMISTHLFGVSGITVLLKERYLFVPYSPLT